MNHFYVLCKEVENGLIDCEKTVTISGYKQGQEEYVRSASDSIIDEGGRQYMQIHLVRKDAATGTCLIQFPTEADSGTYRMWVPEDNVIMKSFKMVPA